MLKLLQYFIIIYFFIYLFIQNVWTETTLCYPCVHIVTPTKVRLKDNTGIIIFFLIEKKQDFL